MQNGMILTEKEARQFDRVLEMVTYGNDGKPEFPEEALLILDELAAGFQRMKEKTQDKHPQPDWIEKISAADAYMNLLALICEAKIGLAMEMSVVLWVPIITRKLQEERQ